MADGRNGARVEVDTEDAARARSTASRSHWTTILVTAWIVLFVVFLVVSVYENAFRYRDVAVSFWIGLAWTLPPLLVLHGIHAVVLRRAGIGRLAPFRRAAARVVAAAEQAGFPEPDRAGVVWMLRSQDNGPDPGTGERGLPDWPLLRWELPLVAPAADRVLVAERTGRPERTVLSVVAVAPDVPDRSTERPRRLRHVPADVDTAGQDAGTLVLGAYRSDSPAPVTASRIGGAPAVPEGWEWPLCAEHDEPMQFTAQVEHRGTLVSVFVCQFDPGTCASWEPDRGANAAFVFTGRALRQAGSPVSPHGDPDDSDPVWPPLLRDSMLLGLAGVGVVADDEEPDRVVDAATAAGITVAGQYGGRPEWIQDDETPDGLEFVASIEPGPLGFDFGDGGRAYVFSDGFRAAVLWQSS
ncbi:hypothetical protein [Curtobacterium sp. PhB115]|uniref:hypothetical protein n=1 Tax=Curtobacterium sp. PhB115 TaxID=2485173 RepID=UPI000F4C441E|nr:hypothetical protein [Curtobacterium sp. PhB115]ROP58606.1 hypothetical protein EDF19_3637 [Curtobacterium sp. PhB115]